MRLCVGRKVDLRTAADLSRLFRDEVLRQAQAACAGTASLAWRNQEMLVVLEHDQVVLA